ncbi:MAG: DsbA family protein [SAR324 cluster bacterium]|nr:DsbA family protein [SAR324 cluster bacterium]
MSKVPIRLTIYYDFLSLWCFNTLLRLKQIEQKWKVRMEWKSYMLLPEQKEQAREAFHLASQSWSAIIDEALAGELKPWPLDREVPNWSLPALAASKVAASFGERQFSDFQYSVMKGYFQEHLDISSSVTLVQLAERSGMDRKAFENQMNQPQWQDLVREEHQQAEAAGIHNVPMVVVNDEQALAGALKIEDYEDAFLKVR